MKLSLTILTFLLYFNTHAQNEKGTFQIGLGGLPVIYPDNTSDTGYSLRANVGYFPMDKFAIGIMPYAGKVEDMQSFGANIYMRYYITDKKVSFFVEAGAGLGDLKYEYTPQINGMMSSFNVGPGIQYSIKNNFSIEFLAQYARLRNVEYPESTTLGNTFIPTIGIQYFIRK